MNDQRPLATSTVEWFERRGIEGETVVRFGIYTGKRVELGRDERGDPIAEVQPDRTGNIIVFPNIENGEIVAESYRAYNRDGSRRVWQKPKGKRQFFNSDILDDDQVISGSSPLVITEGQPDMMIVDQCGHKFVVSVPDGAVQAIDKFGREIPMKPDDEIDPNNDPKFEYVYRNWDRLSKIKRIILAMDGDKAGERMRDELARRLGRVRCAFITYPEDSVVPDPDAREGFRPCKDLNEVKIFFGAARVIDLIQRAKPYPVSGLYTLDDYVPHEEHELFSVGFHALEPIMKLYPGGFAVVSGLPGAGKSAFVDQIAFNMAQNHGWVIAIATFEEDVKPDLQRKLRAFYIKRPIENWTWHDKRDADDFIRKHFVFITRDPVKSDGLCTMDWLIERGEDAVIRYGIDMLIVDPFNNLVHRRSPGEARDEYLDRVLMSLKDFAKRKHVCTFIVAHPTKDGAQRAAQADSMSMIDINGGAAWGNHAEMGIIVHRDSHKDQVTKVFVKKVKFRGTGAIGDKIIPYDNTEERFICERNDDPPYKALETMRG